MNRKAIDGKTVILLTVILTISTFTLTIPPTATAPYPSLGVTQYSWPMFQHDLNNTGYTDSPAPKTKTLLWNTTVGSVAAGGPTVADGIVYTAGTTSNPDIHYVHALNMTTGEKLWNKTVLATVRCAPAVADGIVYFGSESGVFYALNATTGAEEWTYTMDQMCRSHPTVVDGKVYIGSYDGNVYALNAATGALVWNYDTEDKVRGSPAVVDGTLYIGSASDKMYALDAATGEVEWTFTTSPQGDIRGSPAVVDGKVYFGNQKGVVFCLDAATGDKIWNFTTGYYIFSSPAVAYGLVFIGSNDWTLYALDMTTGEKVWSYTLDGIIDYASPTVADGLVFMGSKGDTLYCLNATAEALTAEERLVWSCDMGGDIRGPCAIADGCVFVGTFKVDVGGEMCAFRTLPQGPVASFTFSPASPIPGEAVTFDASASKPGWNGNHSVSIANYTWNFGDLNVTTVTDPVIQHTYTLEGEYTVNLTVTCVDDPVLISEGLTSDSAVQNITVYLHLFKVHNLNTGLDYATIQEAINAPETLDGHTIFVEAGTYYERVTINKNNLTLVGENRNTTIIDGNGTMYACVHLFYSRYVGISEFSIRNGYWGIKLDHAQANDISDNEVTNNKIGVRLFNSDNNRVTGNVVTNNSEGITIGFSTNNTLVNNTISNNTGNFGVYGRYLSHFIHDIDTSNRVNGKPVYYLTEQHNLIINSTTFPQIGYLGLINSTNITVKDINCNGILFAYTNNSRIQNVNASSGVSGVFLVHSFENIISGNSFANNCDGVKVYARPIFPTPFCNNTIVNNVISDNDRGIILDSSGNTIVNNTITSNEGIGVYLYYCEKNVLKGNKMLDNKYGILVQGGSYNNVAGNFVSLNDDGIFLDDAFNNIIDGNLISQNGYGIYSWGSQNNIVRGNTLSNNHEGISLSYYSDYNAIYHNNFLDNAFQARALDSITTWDDGYPSGGNYWSDYNGTDFYSGPYQNETGSDGIGDTPYEIDEYNRDNYPLMSPWPPTPPVIAAVVDIDPDTLNLKSKGKWITCYISLPTGYNVTDINVDTILLNETIPAERSDIQDNVLMVKFKRANVSDFIIESLGKTYGDVTLTVTGELTDGTPFEDSYTFRVICPVNHPANLDKVRVVDCNGNPRNEVEKGRQVFIEAALNNTAPVPENITVTFEVIDCSGVPIDWAVVQRSFSTNLTVLILMLTIPEWASTGTATVYINAYTDPPWANGTPYCPETSTTITLQQA